MWILLIGYGFREKLILNCSIQFVLIATRTIYQFPPCLDEPQLVNMATLVLLRTTNL